MRVALVHDWLTGMRGGERCLEVFAELFPQADLYTHLHVPGAVTPIIEARRIVTSFLQHVPGVRRHYRAYLPLFPAAISRFDLRGYDLVLSSSHAVAKGVRVPAGALHVCYCFTPMRYVWDLYDDYFGRGAGLATRTALSPTIGLTETRESTATPVPSGTPSPMSTGTPTSIPGHEIGAVQFFPGTHVEIDFTHPISRQCNFR